MKHNSQQEDVGHTQPDIAAIYTSTRGQNGEIEPDNTYKKTWSIEL